MRQHSFLEAFARYFRVSGRARVDWIAWGESCERGPGRTRVSGSLSSSMKPPFRRYATRMRPCLRQQTAARQSMILLITVGLGVALFASSARAQCRIEDPRATLREVKVSASGSSFSIGLAEVPVVIRLDAGADPAPIQVLAPLRFSAEVGVAELRYRVKRPVDLHGGRVRVGEGARPTWKRVQGNTMLASIAETLHVEVKQPLRVPCSQIALEEEESFSKTALPVAPPEGLGAGVGAGPIAFYAFPEPSNPIEVRYPGPYTIREERVGWALLEAAWDDGSRLRGWVRREKLTPAPEPPFGTMQGKGGGGCGRSHKPELATFVVRSGAPIAATPGGVPWAWTARVLNVEAFPLDRGDGWLQIGAVAGLTSAPCNEHEHLWVHARNLKWQ